MMETFVLVLVCIVCILYISKRWSQARMKRDVEEMLKPGAGIEAARKKRSPFWYLFK